MMHAMDIVTAITGASGALYAQRFIQGLVIAGVNVHLIVSPLGRRLLHDELGMEAIDLPGSARSTLSARALPRTGWVIVPSASTTLAEVSHGLGDNLISRAAAVTLKE